MRTRKRKRKRKRGRGEHGEREPPPHWVPESPLVFHCTGRHNSESSPGAGHLDREAMSQPRVTVAGGPGGPIGCGRGPPTLLEEHRILGDDFRKYVSAWLDSETYRSCLRLVKEFHMISTRRWIRILRSILVLLFVRALLFSTLRTTSEFFSLANQLIYGPAEFASPRNFLLMCQRVFLEVVNVAQELENTLQPVYVHVHVDTLKGT